MHSKWSAFFKKGSDQPKAAPAAPALFRLVDVVVVFMYETLNVVSSSSHNDVLSSKLQHVDKPASRLS